MKRICLWGMGIVCLALQGREAPLERLRNLIIQNSLRVYGGIYVRGDINVDGTITATSSSIGNVHGPASSTDNGVAVFDGTSGTQLKSSTLKWPTADGAAGQFLSTNGSGQLAFSTPAGGGNVSTASNFSTDNAVIRVDLPSGLQNVQQSGITLDDSNNFSGINIVNQQEARLQDMTGNYVGLKAPTTVASSYSLLFPSATPTAGQYLRANATTPTQLEWIQPGSTVGPVTTRAIYVAKDGNDTTGNGSFSFPYLTVAKALSVANILSSSTTPIAINVGAGIYVEDNSASPLQITANGISIIGESINATIIQPSTLSVNLFSIVVTDVLFLNLSLDAGTGGSTADGVAFNSSDAGVARFQNVAIYRFDIGFNMMSAAGVPIILFDNVQPRGNGTGIALSSIRALIKNSVFLGPFSGATISNTGITMTGATSLITILSSSFRLLSTAISSGSNTNVRILGTNIENTTNGVVCSGGSFTVVEGCNFIVNPASAVNVLSTGSGTSVHIQASHFRCENSLGVPSGTAVKVINQGTMFLDSNAIERAEVGIICGATSDTSSTLLRANSVTLEGNTIDMQQEGSSTVLMSSGTATSTKIEINDSTNVKLAFFDRERDNTLKIGSLTDSDISLIRAAIAQSNSPRIDYLSDLYSTQAIGYRNPNTNPSSWYAIGTSNNAYTTTITTDRTKVAGLRLISDTGATVGTTTALRGWDVNKNGTTGDLSFNYQNSDLTGQSAITQYTMMELDGVNNQLLLPNTSHGDPTIVFASDTNLYRSAANTLKTDDNFVTAGTANVNTTLTLATGSITDSTGAISFSNENLSTTGPLGAGATTITGSSDTTQLKVVGNGAQTQPIFDMQTSAAATLLSLSNAGLLTLNGTMTSSGLMSMNVPISSITGDKNLTTKEYVDSIASGLHPIGSVTAVENVSNQTLSGAPVTIDGVSVAAGQEVLLNAQSTGSENGPWTVNAGAWTRPADFANGSTIVAGTSVFVTSGSTYASSTWVLTEGAGGTVDTTPVKFALFAQAGTTTASNVGGATGNVFKQKTGNDLEFKTLGSTDTHFIVTDNASTVTFATDATSSNTASTIVARDGSGNFSAGTITATTLAGTLSTAAQPNITSLGTLTGLTMGGTLNLNSNAITNGSTISATTFNGALNGTASGNLPLTGGTLSGALQLPVGTASIPSLQFAATNVGISSPSSNLILSTNGTSRLTVSSGGTIAIPSFTTAGVVHNDASGNLSSSLIVNADIDAAAAIVDTKLATISTAGKVLNSATTATSSNTASAIVARDGSGDFSAGTITANLTGSVTGAASLNVLKAGDTMTGALTLPAGSAASPSLKFSGSTNTGLSAAVANTLSFDTQGVERMNITTTINTVAPFLFGNIHCDQAIQTASPATGATVTAASTTSILLLTPAANVTITVVFPSSPTNGQLFSIVSGTGNTINITNSAPGTTIVNAITSLNDNAWAATSGGTMVTYLYLAATTSWYRFARG